MYIMSYFRYDEKEGMYLAAGEDLLHWKDLNQGKAVLVPDEGYILRDPFLLADKEGGFHVFFTDNWTSCTIGHSLSRDLMNWAPVNHIMLMNEYENILNCWAPEVFWNREKEVYQLIWSSVFAPQGWDVTNRIWTAEMSGFHEVKNVRLYFDPGYPVIDATVLTEESGYFMAFKDERGNNCSNTDYKAIRTCRFQNTDSGFEEISDLLTGNLCEGPCLMKKDGIYYLFYDSFGDGTYRVICSEDFTCWEEITHLAEFPEQCKHMSIIQI